MDIGLLNGKQWQPLSYLGINHPFFSINSDTIINTWVVIGAIILLIFVSRWILRYKSSTGRYIVLTYIRSFIDLCSQSFGYFSFEHTAFIIALFTFIIFCNCIAVLPWVEEPTKDLNTTLGLGLLAFTYIQIAAMRTHGILGYLKEYFLPFFFMFPLHIIGKISTIISISFRLFGNIFGSATIVHIYTVVIEKSWIYQTAGLLTGTNLTIVGFFILFEGFLQAFVFTMLAMTYLAIALSHEEVGEMT